MRSHHKHATARSFGTAVLLLVSIAVGPAARAGTQTTAPPLKQMTVNLHDEAALRTGALYFMHRCSSCHSMQGMRLSELQRPLDLNKKEIKKYLDISGRSILQTMTSSMPRAVAKKFLNVKIPDLTVMAKAHSVDWLYTYLISFYLDPARPTGVNNVVVNNVAMPDVFSDLQGLQTPVTKAGYRYGKKTQVAVGVHQVSPGAMSPKQFDRAVRDIVSFLYLAAHPHQTTRHAIGPWVLAFFAAFTALIYLIYRLYWRNVAAPEAGRWWRYRRRDS